MSGFAPCVLVTTKAPIPGMAKTRLAAVIGVPQAARLAAAAFLDSLDAVESVTSSSTRLVALAGDLREAARGDEIAARLRNWHVVSQQGASFAERLVRAHRDAAAAFGHDATLVQIGTDTPQITAHDLMALGAAVDPDTRPTCQAALGPATDGGWWGLATGKAGYADVLREVPMSRPDTCDLTQAALESTGARVSRLHMLTDVDTIDDAFAVAAIAPRTRFAQQLAQIAHGAAQ